VHQLITHKDNFQAGTSESLRLSVKRRIGKKYLKVEQTISVLDLSLKLIMPSCSLTLKDVNFPHFKS